MCRALCGCRGPGGNETDRALPGQVHRGQVLLVTPQHACSYKESCKLKVWVPWERLALAGVKEGFLEEVAAELRSGRE